VAVLSKAKSAESELSSSGSEIPSLNISNANNGASAISARSLEHALARSPRKEYQSSPKVVSPTTPTKSEQTDEEEVVLSPREMIREQQDEEDVLSAKRRQVSPRSKLKKLVYAGGSRSKVKITE
jgi:hypothetical protein